MTRSRRWIWIVGAGAASLVVAAVVAPPLAGQTIRSQRRAQGPDVESSIRRNARVQLAESGGRIGLAVRDVDAADVSREKLAAPRGAVVTDVEADGPASTAGFRAGDVIVTFDGESVRSASQLTRLVRESPAGRPVNAIVSRGTKRVTLDVTPAESDGVNVAGPVDRLPDLPSIDGRRFDPPLIDGRRFERRVLPPLDFGFDLDLGRDGWPRQGRLGVAVQELSPDLASYFGVESGVLVSSVAADSPAAGAGVKAGDVIRSVNGDPTESPRDLRRQVNRVDDNGAVTLGVVRDKKDLTLTATLGSSSRSRVTRRSI